VAIENHESMSMKLMTFLLAALTSANVLSAGLSSPLYKADMNPLTLGYAGPQSNFSTTLGQGRWRWQMGANIANTVQSDSNSFVGDSVLIDAETAVIRLAVEYGLTDHWNMVIDLPYIAHGKGKLDGTINQFHDIFSFPEGPRGDRPEDLFAVSYQREGQYLVNLVSPQSEFGDMGVSLTYSLDKSWVQNLKVGAKLKVPTGDSDHLTGSGTHDIAFWLSAANPLGNKFSHFLTFGGTLIEQDKGLLSDMRNPGYGFLSYGVAWRYSPAVDLKIQLDTRSAIYKQTDLLPLRSATTVRFGGTLRLSNNYILEVAIAEDIAVGTAPDVVFQFNVTRNSSF